MHINLCNIHSVRHDKDGKLELVVLRLLFTNWAFVANADATICKVCAIGVEDAVLRVNVKQR